MTIDRVKLITEMAKQRLQVNQLAERSGVSRMTVTAVRSGKSCSAETAEKLARGLGVKVSEIMETEV